MIPSFLKALFRRAEVQPTKPQTKEEKRNEALAVDPLDPIQKRKHSPWEQPPEFKLRSATEFPVFDGLAGDVMQVTTAKAMGDAALSLASKGTAAMDELADDGTGMLKVAPSTYTVPAGLFQWYMSQGFIGYQACAIIAQHWLVDKACSQAGEDAVRNGWVIKARGGDDLEDEEHEAILEADKEFKVKENLIELNRFKNVFGIRVAIFQVQSDDPLYYEKPFNIDGIKEGSYKGISQVDPYWMMPVMTSKGTSDPADKDFYDPEYWTISGRKYHKSHLCIVRGPQPADILKPTYIFGGVPLTQRIYERVYAAERTANEAPLMAMSKRTMAIHADLEKVMADQAAFEQRLLTWIRYRDNHGVKVLGKEEAMEQFDINMSDFDSVIMNQYQLVSAIARTPATKLLGTSPKGFNATGEHEIKTYNEEKESIQEHTMMPMLTRHYDILGRHLGISTQLEVVCNEVDSVSQKERAELNKLKADTATVLINNGTISPDEDRNRLRDDPHGGYNRLTDEDADEEPGMSPENKADLEKAKGQLEKGNAAEQSAPSVGMRDPSQTEPEDDSATNTLTGAVDPTSGTLQALVPFLMSAIANAQANPQSPDPVQAALLLLMHQLASKNVQAGQAAALENVDPPIQGTKPGTRGIERGVQGIHGVVSEAKDSFAEDWNPHVLPKLRIGKLTCMIENPRNSVRKGIDMNGKPWSVKMANHYGFIKGYEGADGDELDCFVGPNLRSQDVYVVQQKGLDGEFDEHKCMLGFDSDEEAKAAYHANFKPGWDGFDCMQKMSMDEFHEWLDCGAACKPLTHRA
jgi:phage-related protein (TIGR01555 family)